MKKFYIIAISVVFLLCLLVILAFGKSKLVPLLIISMTTSGNFSCIQNFFKFDEPYTGIAIVKTTLPSESIQERRSSFHTDLFLYSFFSFLFAFGSIWIKTA